MEKATNGQTIPAAANSSRPDGRARCALDGRVQCGKPISASDHQRQISKSRPGNCYRNGRHKGIIVQFDHLGIDASSKKIRVEDESMMPICGEVFVEQTWLDTTIPEELLPVNR
jgi:hypothetical protein